MLIYFLVFLAKTIEVTLATVRMVLITKGIKIMGSIIGFFEILIWLAVASNVIDSIKEDPVKGIFYAIGFSAGCYLGTIVEDKIAIGKILITVVLSGEKGCKLLKSLRGRGLGVTEIDGKGLNDPKKILYIVCQRKDFHKIKRLILEVDPFAMVFSSEMKSVHGGCGFGVIK